MESRISAPSDYENTLSGITFSQVDDCSRQNCGLCGISPTDSVGERISVSSTSSDFTPVDLPEVIPDALDIPDLGLCIQKVVERVNQGPPPVQADIFGSEFSLEEKRQFCQLQERNSRSFKTMSISDSTPHLSASFTSSYQKLIVNGLGESQTTINCPASPSELNQENAIAADIKEPTHPACFASFPEPVVMGSDIWVMNNEANSTLGPVIIPQNVANELRTHAVSDTVIATGQHTDNSTKLESPTVFGTDGFDDDDFGEFTCVATQPGTDLFQNAEQCMENRGILERLLSHLEPVLGRIFQLGVDTMLDDRVSVTTTDYLQSDATIRVTGDRSVPSAGLWDKLLSNRMHDFRYRWNKSSIYEACLQSIHVDMRHAMPPFATHLRLLEPVKLTHQKPLDPVPTLASPCTVPDVRPLYVTPSPYLSGTPPPDHSQVSTSVFGNPNDVTISTSALDLDALDIGPVFPVRISTDCSRSNLFELERELLADVPPPVPLPIQCLPQLSSGVIHNSAPDKPSRSSNVRAALARLPKLTYMRAKCLMFPLPETRST